MEILGEKTNCAFAAHNSVIDVVVDCVASHEISGRVTDSVAVLLKLLSDLISVR